jgi:hypothetical protein
MARYFVRKAKDASIPTSTRERSSRPPPLKRREDKKNMKSVEVAGGAGDLVACQWFAVRAITGVR